MLRYFRFHLLSSKRKLEIYAQSQNQLLTRPFILLAGHLLSLYNLAKGAFNRSDGVFVSRSSLGHLLLIGWWKVA